MKSLILTITGFAVLNLAMTNYALAQQNPPETEDQDIVERSMEAAQKQMEAAKDKMDTAKEVMEHAKEEMKKAGQKVNQAVQERTHIVLKTKFGDFFGRGRRGPDGDGRILVIPAAEIETQDFVTIMEDMSVMSRILDKKLGYSHYTAGYSSRSGYGGFAFSRETPVTESIYIDGYGALFLMTVDFPLASPAEPAEEETKEDLDPIWEQTKREIYAPEDDKADIYARYYDRSSAQGREPSSEEKYDAEKVEDLKRKLTQALKHAANIRSLKPDEWVVLSVIGGPRNTTGPWSAYVVVQEAGPEAPCEHERVSTSVGFPLPTVVTIRVEKSDVDDFSKGELDFPEFREKVQILTY